MAEHTSHGGLEARYLSQPVAHEYVFSFVTLVADEERYQRMIASLEAKGFTPETTELIALDNRGENRFDGYSYLRRALPDARGEFIVLVHDDVEFIHDDFDTLVSVLSDLTAQDPMWGVAGNAGAGMNGEMILHIDDPHGVRRVDGIERSQSLDENFMIVRRDHLVMGSLDIGGFHFYGPDLCLQAELQGATSYVIPFLLRHHSGGGKSEGYFAVQARFENKYDDIFSGREYRTTTARLYLGGKTFAQTAESALGRLKRKLRLK